MALARCILGTFLGVGCHFFPPPLDVPTFSARCLYVQRRERPLATEGGTLRGREMFWQISPRIRFHYISFMHGHTFWREEFRRFHQTVTAAHGANKVKNTYFRSWYCRCLFCISAGTWGITIMVGVGFVSHSRYIPGWYICKFATLSSHTHTHIFLFH